MDLPCVQWQDHVAQKWVGIDPDLKEHFTSLLEIDDIFKCSLSTITPDDLDFVDSVSVGYSVQKDAEKAARCREGGNSSFRSRDYTSAALHYTQGACFAPVGSEQLSLCYANRSAALYHLQHYQESLDDISKAMKSGYPPHLLHKLKERRTQCLKHLSVSQKAKEDGHNTASKNHGPEEQGSLQCGICPEAVMSFDPEKGRHLVATERIGAGEVILTDRPYSCVLIPGMEGVRGTAGGQDTEGGVFGTEQRRCHRCLRETLSAVPCDWCSYSRYCSTSCQKEAWEEHHHWECPVGADLMVMGVMSQLALRVTLKAGLRNVQRARDPIREELTKSQPSCLNSKSPHSYSCHSTSNSDSYLRVFHLLHHLNRHSPCLRFLYAVTIATVFLKLSKVGPPPSSWDFSGLSREKNQSNQEGDITDWGSEMWLLGSAALRHIMQLGCNAQAITMLQNTGTRNSAVQSSREIRIATAIFPTLSLLNHSCSPNTSMVFESRDVLCGSELSADISERVAEERSKPCRVTVTVRAAKVIPLGQEILHCYGPDSRRMATKDRQHLLLEQYFFLCCCEACSLQQQQDEEEEEKQEKGTASGLLCGKCKGSLRKFIESKGKGFMCSQSCCGHRMSSSEVSRSLQSIRSDLEKVVDLLQTEQPDKALKILRTKCRSGLILAETHPLQGELDDATARAYAAMGDWNNAAYHLQRSAAAVGSQYGEDSIELGYQLFKLVQLHFNGGSRAPALSLIPKVRHLLRLHRGPRCQELQELRAMEDCLRG
ncbi:SET and MYND domain-containing protein 4 [Antennarius striatus]|uniref:SET and MYND domain-containing protein 4 n=1 Tax=Antennarius striatus TaxID=241820 RepID=UPI0035AE658F